MTKKALYGYCPVCGERGLQRERRMNGNDTCARGHQYPSRDAIPEAVEKKDDK